MTFKQYCKIKRQARKLLRQHENDIDAALQQIKQLSCEVYCEESRMTLNSFYNHVATYIINKDLLVSPIRSGDPVDHYFNLYSDSHVEWLKVSNKFLLYFVTREESHHNGYPFLHYNDLNWKQAQIVYERVEEAHRIRINAHSDILQQP